MAKVRITKKPRTGDQIDYSLYTTPGYGSFGTNEPSDTPPGGSLRDTMGPVDKKLATLVAERGETVVGDLDNDGNLEHARVGGKPHSRGGTPLNVPQGSFVFSHLKKLRIKDPLTLEHFTKNARKTGYTPAEIARQYEINSYMEALNDPHLDPISRNTYTMMIANNNRKLAELSLVQEGMKGFPKGIPDIALPLLNEQEQGMPEMAWGGTVGNFAGGGQLESFGPGGSLQKGHAVYINGQQHKIIKRYRGTFGGEWIEFDKPVRLQDADGKWVTHSEFNVADIQKGLKEKYLDLVDDSGILGFNRDFRHPDALDPLDLGISMPGRGSTYNRLAISNRPNPKQAAPAPAPVKKFTQGNKTYEVVNDRAIDNGGQKIQVRQVQDDDRNIGSFMDTYGGYKLMSQDEYDAAINRTSGSSAAVLPAAQQVQQTDEQYARGQREVNAFVDGQSGAPAAGAPAVPATQIPAPVPVSQNAPAGTPAARTPAAARKRVVEEDLYDAEIKFARGGQLTRYAEGGGSGPGPGPRVKIRKDERGQPYAIIVDPTSGREIARTYMNKNDKTPTGRDASFNLSGGNFQEQGEYFGNWYSNWVKTLGVEPLSIKDNADLQTRIYEHMLEKDPESLVRTWEETGLNYAATPDMVAGLRRVGAKVEATGTQGGRTKYKVSFDGVSDFDKKAVLRSLSGAYADNKLGQRSLATNAPVPPQSMGEELDIKYETVAPPVKPAAQAEVEREKDIDPNALNQQTARRGVYAPGNPWTQDVINTGAAMAARHNINSYYPYLPQVDPMMPDFVPVDPGRQIAAAQSAYNTMAEEMTTMSSPQQARAALSQGAGKTMEQVAGVISQYDNANREGASQNQAARAGIYNNAEMVNENARKEHVDRLSTLYQQRDNARSQAGNTVRRNFNQMLTNMQKTAWMQANTPQYSVDPLTGALYFDESAGLNIGDEVMGQQARGRSDYGAVMDISGRAQMENQYREAYERAGYSPEEARNSARKAISDRVQMNQNYQRQSQRNPQTPFPAAPFVPQFNYED